MTAASIRRGGRRTQTTALMTPEVYTEASSTHTQAQQCPQGHSSNLSRDCAPYDEDNRARE